MSNFDKIQFKEHGIQLMKKQKKDLLIYSINFVEMNI